MSFSKSFTVYFADTDAAQVVHHARYITWLEAARIDFLDYLGCSYVDLQKERIGLVPVSIDINYHKPLVFGDRFEIVISVSSLKQACVWIKGDVVRGQELCCSSIVKLACIDETTWKPMKFPTALLQAFKRI
jgi:acyl-CoA thioester hydrolase